MSMRFYYESPRTVGYLRCVCAMVVALAGFWLIAVIRSQPHALEWTCVESSPEILRAAYAACMSDGRSDKSAIARYCGEAAQVTACVRRDWR